jgi:hypothetical protein
MGTAADDVNTVINLQVLRGRGVSELAFQKDLLYEVG